MRGIRIGLFLVMMLGATMWAGFLIATHRAVTHKLDWLMVAAFLWCAFMLGPGYGFSRKLRERVKRWLQ